ncbi:Arylsulfatase A [Algibacter lectus]|uniref:sulfatase-like hydrolase/transferase n=1 Tax=Algibacter lectus TaxID=221126 RepID=UPI0008E7EC44|nr:sulfatase-like hydrolase/transferase [Algibacter lectus]SFC04844.1 Arylsulfatase A [Algibacter lectus]
MKKKVSIISLLIVSFLCGQSTLLTAQNRPNVLVILADDLGYHDVGFTGCKDIFTPQLDKLANNGIVFTNGYVTHPYCGPSRAGLITGRYQARFGMEINSTYSPFDLYMGLPLEEKTFAKRMQETGYRTGIIGKWHLGAAAPYHPNNRGFDHFYGFLSGGHTYFPEQVNTIIPLVNKKGKPNYGANEGDFYPLVLNNGAGEFNEYLTTALSRDAAKFVKESDTPFMLYLAYNAPHMPLQAPKETIEKYKHIESKERRIYAAMIDKMDEGIGMVVDALKESGKLDNTIIFFLSDNGGVATTGYNNEIFSSNYPFKKGKGSMYEGGSHVPFIVHWPNGVKKPRQFEGLVSSLDIAATAIAVSEADTENAKLDGVNLLPYLQNEVKGSPHSALFWRASEGKGWAVRTSTSKFLLENKNMALYNMELDPFESNNLIESSNLQRKKMANLWNNWNANNQPVIWLQANAYQKKRLEMYRELHEELKVEALKRTPKTIE